MESVRAILSRKDVFLGDIRKVFEAFGSVKNIEGKHEKELAIFIITFTDPRDALDAAMALDKSVYKGSLMSVSLEPPPLRDLFWDPLSEKFTEMVDIELPKTMYVLYKNTPTVEYYLSLSGVEEALKKKPDQDEWSIKTETLNE
jgi:hypothetical protein